MNTDNGFLEREIRKIIVRLHQEIFGRGPEQLWVRIEQNICTFSCAKTLTPMEDFLLATPSGSDKVMELRKVIAEAANSRLCQEIELLCRVKVLSSTGKICIEADTVYGAILLLRV